MDNWLNSFILNWFDKRNPNHVIQSYHLPVTCKISLRSRRPWINLFTFHSRYQRPFVQKSMLNSFRPKLLRLNSPYRFPGKPKYNRKLLLPSIWNYLKSFYRYPWQMITNLIQVSPCKKSTEKYLKHYKANLSLIKICFIIFSKPSYNGLLPLSLNFKLYYKSFCNILRCGNPFGKRYSTREPKQLDTHPKNLK